MINTQSVDLLHIIPGQFKKVASTNGGEYHGSCPFCGSSGRNSDRFVIQPNADPPRWWCRKCNKKGDAIAFQQQYNNLSFVDAVKALNLENQLNQQSNSQSNIRMMPTPTNIAPSKDDIPALDNPEWQEKAQKFVEWSWRNLHSGNYPDIQKYLDERGFTDFDTDIWKLGYVPKTYRWDWGGVQCYVPEGIVIPYLGADDETIYKINIRKTTANPKPKYQQIKGGANWLFNSHRIKADSIVVLVEGELDAISIAVGFNHYRVVPVATGSSTGARWLRWPALLASAYKVLIAFDDDEAGENATKWWAQYLPNCRRLLPEMKDCNDMLVNSYPFDLWIKKGLGQ